MCVDGAVARRGRMFGLLLSLFVGIGDSFMLAVFDSCMFAPWDELPPG